MASVRGVMSDLRQQSMAMDRQRAGVITIVAVLTIGVAVMAFLANPSRMSVSAQADL